ncbi:GDYXXLXY domain-containing protein [Aquibium sp. LZ166]|uniref:GDYXXLXY domain-containing protein n=1 Tax=Aquibium pacificus TaxID=3153579 RepID=A0ABV3SPE4_9HYPH
MKRSTQLIGGALVVSALQIGFLYSIIQGRAAILRDGAEVMLKVEPVDPRDLLRGDYVRLGYEISSIPRTLFDPPLADADATGGTPVLVRLAPGDDGLWHPVGARLTDTEPSAMPESQVEIAGTVDTAFAAIDQVRLSYGIERFYLPEGEGREIERDMRERPFMILAAVGEDGTAQIKAFFDGKTQLYEEPLY